jgi:hypothetical protein
MSLADTRLEARKGDKTVVKNKNPRIILNDADLHVTLNNFRDNIDPKGSLNKKRNSDTTGILAFQNRGQNIYNQAKIEMLQDNLY